MAKRIKKHEAQEAKIAASGSSPGSALEAENSPGDPVLPVDVLLENSKALFGVPPYTIIGAMADAPTKSQYAVSEVQAYLSAIGSRPVR